MKKIYVDDSKCLSCHSCELACAVAHSLSKNLFCAVAESNLPLARIFVEKSGRGSFPLQCRHCDEPQCVKACITKSLYKDVVTNGVLHDENKCIGCFMCVMACPFGAIEETYIKNKNAVSKCDLCVENKDGQACVRACPTKALSFSEADSFSKNKRKELLKELTVNQNQD